MHYVLDQIIEEKVDPNYAFEMHKYFNDFVSLNPLYHLSIKGRQ